MEVIDYNGVGRWSRKEILARYARYAAERKCLPRDLSPMEHTTGDRHWVYPVMEQVMEGIKDGDLACICLGVEFIEEDAKFVFGKSLKAGAARALRRAILTAEQKKRIRRRVFGLLRAGHIPHEYRDYAKLVRTIGFQAHEVPEITTSNRYVVQFWNYFHSVAKTAAQVQ